MPRLPVADPHRMGRSAEQQGALCFAYYRDDKEAQGILTAPRGGHIALEQGCIDRLGGFAHGGSLGTRRLKKRVRRIVQDAGEFGVRDAGIARGHQVQDQIVLLAPARGFARGCVGEQTRQVCVILSVMSANGEEV